MSVFLSFLGKIILNKISKYYSRGLEVSSRNPKDIGLSLYPSMLHFNSLMMLLKYVPLADR